MSLRERCTCKACQQDEGGECLSKKRAKEAYARANAAMVERLQSKMRDLKTLEETWQSLQAPTNLIEHAEEQNKSFDVVDDDVLESFEARWRQLRNELKWAREDRDQLRKTLELTKKRMCDVMDSAIEVQRAETRELNLKLKKQKERLRAILSERDMLLCRQTDRLRCSDP